MDINLNLTVTHQISPELMHVLRGIFRLEKKNVADKQAILDQLARQTAEIEKQKGVVDSVKTFVSQQAAAQKALADQVAALQAGSVTQAEIDSLAAQLTANADALAENDNQIANAITANPT